MKCAEARGEAALAVGVPAELDEVGEDQVGQAEVAFELVGLFDLIQVGTDVLGFDEAEGELDGLALALDAEVRVADFSVLGLGKHMNRGVEFL